MRAAPVRRGGWLNTSVGVPLPFFFGRRSPDEAQRNPGSSIQAGTPFPDFASLHPGYSSYRTQNSGAERVAGTLYFVRHPEVLGAAEADRAFARWRGRAAPALAEGRAPSSRPLARGPSG